MEEPVPNPSLLYIQRYYVKTVVQLIPVFLNTSLPNSATHDTEAIPPPNAVVVRNFLALLPPPRPSRWNGFSRRAPGILDRADGAVRRTRSTGPRRSRRVFHEEVRGRRNVCGDLARFVRSRGILGVLGRGWRVDGLLKGYYVKCYQMFGLNWSVWIFSAAINALIIFEQPLYVAVFKSTRI